MTSLAEAPKTSSVVKFVKEHRRDPRDNATAFNTTLPAMA
jgi:hypothetical protein